MQFPRIILKIQNHTPQIILETDENHAKNLISEEENLADIIFEIADELNLLQNGNDLSKDEKYKSILELASEGDERFLETKLNLDIEKPSFQLRTAIEKEFDLTRAELNSFEEYMGKTSEEVINELVRNQNVDVLASILEMIYSILIAKTLLSASDLGIRNIHISDDSKNLRLQERMASELSKIDIELQFRINLKLKI